MKQFLQFPDLNSFPPGTKITEGMKMVTKMLQWQNQLSPILGKRFVTL